MFRAPAHAALALRELEPAPDLLDAVARLRGARDRWLLDSALPDPRLGRFSFAGADPYLVLRARGRRVELDCRRAPAPAPLPARRVLTGDPLALARALLPPAPAQPAPFPFVGGAVGALGYELAEQCETLGLRARDDLGLPDVTLLYVDRLLVVDHAAGRRFAVGLGLGRDAARAAAAAERAVAALLRRLRAGPRRAPAPPAPRPRPPFAFFDAARYAGAVEEIKREIAAGNVYQACLTHRVERDYHGDAFALYRRLRALNPAPFACFFDLPEVAIVGSSPERFLRVAADRGVESRPIKGTRPRHRDPRRDAALRAELPRCEKDRAENLMIVDLVRNDLGRVCETGSVAVPELMRVEEYASVFQLVSSVTGRLRGDRDAFDLVRAAFPPGSMTGAPKLAAMALLDRLEPVRRGVYAGAIGYFDARGGADLSVAIRTILLRGGRAYVHSGGGVVADSDPLGEYREAFDKVRPLCAALEGRRRQPAAAARAASAESAAGSDSPGSRRPAAAPPARPARARPGAPGR